MDKGGGQVTGYRYYIGAHFVLSLAPVDGILAIRFQDKVAWIGNRKSGRIKINKPSLFGGDNKEGGVVGEIDILDGNDTQPVNDYLQARFDEADGVTDTPVSAYRGVVSAVFRQLMIGNNPFLKPVSFKEYSVFQGVGGWKASKAPLNGEFTDTPPNIYIGIDASQSMFDSGNIDTVKSVLQDWIVTMSNASANVKLVSFAAEVEDSIEVLGTDAAGWDSISDWVDALAEPVSTGDVPVTPRDITAGTKDNNTNSVPAFSAYDYSFQGGYWTGDHYPDLEMVEPFGDLVIGANGGSDGYLYFDVDFTDFPVGTEITYQDVVTVVRTGSYTGLLSGVADIAFFVQTAAGGAIRTVSQAYDTSTTGGAGTFTTNRLISVTRASETEARLRLRLRIDEASYAGGGGYTVNTSFSDSTMTYTGGDACDWEAGMAPATAFFAANDNSDVDNPVSTTPLGGLPIFQAAGDNNSRGAPNVVIWLTEGDPLPTSSAAAAAVISSALPNTDVYAYQIDNADTTYSELVDNTERDEVPNLDGSSEDALTAVWGGVAIKWLDRNAAHILRDLLLKAEFGGLEDDSIIGDTFATAADTLFSEGMGLSLEGKSSTLDSLRKQIEEHIDASVYFDRITGKWEIKLIRDDYDVGSLITIDDDIVSDWGTVTKPLQEELPNAVTVVYTKREDGSTASVTLHNIAAIQEVGRVIPEKREYPYFTWPPLASRVAERDLAALTVPLWAGNNTRLTYLPEGVNVGSAIIIDAPRLGVNSIVARITEVNYGGHDDASVTINWSEDKFAIDDAPRVNTPSAGADNSRLALVPVARFAEEAPFYVSVFRQGYSDTMAQLEDDPDLGYMAVAPTRPNDQHIDAQIVRQSGSDWIDAGASGLAPYAVLSEALDKLADTTEFDVPYNSTLDYVKANTLASIGSEIVRIDNMVNNAGTVTITVGRGCLDTVPQAHEAGDYLLFWSEDIGSDQIAYTAAETVTVRLLPRTFSDTLQVGSATSDAITFDSRMIRPYPPGDVQADGSYVADIAFDGSVSLTWAHRDRLLQTTETAEDYTASDIGPEASTTYTVRLYWREGDGTLISTTDRATGLTGTSYTLTDITTGRPAGVATIGVSVVAVRDSYECWQTFEFTYIAANVLETQDGDFITTQDGSYITVAS